MSSTPLPDPPSPTGSWSTKWRGGSPTASSTRSSTPPQIGPGADPPRVTYTGPHAGEPDLHSFIVDAPGLPVPLVTLRVRHPAPPGELSPAAVHLLSARIRAEFTAAIRESQTEYLQELQSELERTREALAGMADEGSGYDDDDEPSPAEMRGIGLYRVMEAAGAAHAALSSQLHIVNESSATAHRLLAGLKQEIEHIHKSLGELQKHEIVQAGGAKIQLLAMALSGLIGVGGFVLLHYRKDQIPAQEAITLQIKILGAMVSSGGLYLLGPEVAAWMYDMSVKIRHTAQAVRASAPAISTRDVVRTGKDVLPIVALTGFGAFLGHVVKELLDAGEV